LQRKCAIVEVGSWKGKSTIWLGKGSQVGNSVKIYAIDPHTGSSEHRKVLGKVSTFEEFRRNIKVANVDDVVIPMVKTSEEAAKNFKEVIEFLFLDGAHEYELVKLDFQLWFPKLISGGTIAFHDTIGYSSSADPKKLVEEYVFKSKHFRKVGFVGSTTYAQKVEQNCLKDRLRNRYLFFLKGFMKYR